MNKVILSACNMCDIGPELSAETNINYFPFHVYLDGKAYRDGVDIMPEDIYRAWREKKILPTTAAASPGEYAEYFKKFTDDGYDVIHVELGSGISSTYQNGVIAAAEFPGRVFMIDSQNLSSAYGLIVLEAAERIRKGLPAEQIAREVNDLVSRSHASFIIDTLEFLHAGGRCSALAHFGANLLQLKPCIEVDNTNGGKMNVGKKYRGTLKKALEQYIMDKLQGRGDLVKKRAFITHSGIDDEYIDMVLPMVRELGGFEKVYVTRASCTISAHCGPNTLGVLFMTEE